MHGSILALSKRRSPLAVVRTHIRPGAFKSDFVSSADDGRWLSTGAFRLARGGSRLRLGPTGFRRTRMATRPKGEAKPTDVRGKIVDALMELASEQRFEEISIRDICKAADVSLADFRDLFPSKGAVLAGFSRRIDHAVLAQSSEELADESPRERLFDILMRRLEAMAPYREGLREVTAWLRRSPGGGAGDESGRHQLDALHGRGGGHRGRRRRRRGDQAAGAGARLGAHRRRLARGRGSWPVEDDGRARSRTHARRESGRRGGSRQRARRAVPGDRPAASRRAGAAAIAAGARVAAAKRRRCRTPANTERRWYSRQSRSGGLDAARSAAVRADDSNLNHSLQRLLAMRRETRTEPRRYRGLNQLR